MSLGSAVSAVAVTLTTTPHVLFGLLMLLPDAASSPLQPPLLLLTAVTAAGAAASAAAAEGFPGPAAGVPSWVWGFASQVLMPGGVVSEGRLIRDPVLLAVLSCAQLAALESCALLAALESDCCPAALLERFILHQMCKINQSAGGLPAHWPSEVSKELQKSALLFSAAAARAAQHGAMLAGSPSSPYPLQECNACAKSLHPQYDCAATVVTFLAPQWWVPPP
jgi:hypothetical protein